MYVVISRDQCNFCDSAKALLKGCGISYSEYNVQSSSSRWVANLMVKADLKTVPQIFDDAGKHIGGYTELKELLEPKS